MRINLSKICCLLSVVCCLFLSGCVSLISKMVTTRGDIRVPAVVAHLEPILLDNKILILGKIVVSNPTESALEVKPVYLSIEDESSKILSRSVLEWQKRAVEVKEELDAPVEIELDLSVLNKEYINVKIKTEFIYKKLEISIPVEERIAVLHLKALKDTIRKPLEVKVFTKFYPDLLGNVAVEYNLGIINPVSIDLMLEDGLIQIHPGDSSQAVKSFLAQTLFKGEQETQISGIINLGKDVGARIIAEFIKGDPVKVEVSGKLKLAEADIFMPFKVETIQKLELSLFRLQATGHR